MANPDTLPADFFKGKQNPDTLPGDFKGGKIVSSNVTPIDRDKARIDDDPADMPVPHHVAAPPRRAADESFTSR